MSRRKQAKPRALKHDGDEEVDAPGVATTIRQHNGTVKGTSAEEDMKGDSMLEDITDDDERAGEEQDLEDTSDDEPEMEVKPKDAKEGSVTRCKDMKSVCELEVNPCEGRSSVGANVATSNDIQEEDELCADVGKSDYVGNSSSVQENRKGKIFYLISY
uniref:uncharacterized protein LOC125907531 n=1 Tax=Anopheles coluzzii TaxID=1518534 RepID=UPI0020FF9E76|nr:uncharacterized protein LOC125907531 [Anopheles coluzzii]